ncbi:hypothetical protein CKL83_09705 [Bacillus anthracis]|uniref:Uncharacterized protein n=4 Tax=Bacillus cereus group TaxID=86661 RepID=A0AAC8SDU6_BACAN|nr:hypothetical protein BA_0917 [Bacillus anthracis str. Ames]AAT30029.1 hypothetical protein GBAA_0917 [Bacillus anthracis str. 'Ames Ancestor']ACP12167.1 hypothetical protein BAMEG_3646 [Bacillus anthracis str. CDC 684]ACQ48196.1 hypothetical protein BAA_1019 [Bacillus anthracis str. A0248]AFH82260.1 Hypothetical Protein H9401_0874 [Bacillus anthracis str. H9401]AHK37057.1 hypothetical protein BAPAT_0881 [Bacillus anthracis str. SVA11]AIK34280.1 hypothetical protein DJ48_3259 [Bacillus anth
MDAKVLEVLRMLNNYEGNEKEIFELIQAEVMVKFICGKI